MRRAISGINSFPEATYPPAERNFGTWFPLGRYSQALARQSSASLAWDCLNLIDNGGCDEWNHLSDRPCRGHSIPSLAFGASLSRKQKLAH
jgi:hypothetical protein